MEAELKARLDRLELALSTLINSISTYNPSVTAAESVVAADDDLGRGLEKLVEHQRNYQEILRLRELSNEWDGKLKATLSSLAQTRAEIKSSLAELPSSQTNKARPLNSSELLDYAQRIARYTVPPTYRGHLPQTIIKESATDSMVAHQNTTQADIGKESESQGKAVVDLAPEIQAWLNPTDASIFTPWPEDDVIRKGALSRIEELWEKKVDPRNNALVHISEAEGR